MVNVAIQQIVRHSKVADVAKWYGRRSQVVDLARFYIWQSVRHYQSGRLSTVADLVKWYT